MGHRRFAVVGHDRGARIAYRLALDHPEAVSKLVVPDIRKRWATDVRGSVIQSGHFVAEEKPREVLAALVPFLRG